MVDTSGHPLAALVTAGQANDSPQMIPIPEAISVARIGGGRARRHPDRVLADRAYSCRTNRAWLRRKQIKATIPEPADQIAGRKRRGAAGGRPPAFNADRYKDRSGIERAIARLKQLAATRTVHRSTDDAEEVVIGVDTHKDAHVAAVATLTGTTLDTRSFPATSEGYRQLLTWAKSFGSVRRAGVECTGSYGAALTRYLHRQDVTVVEVNQPDRATRRRRGKTDTIDAEAAAQAVLSGRVTATAKTTDGPVEAIRVFRMAKTSAVKARSQAINQLKAVIVVADPDLRESLHGLSNTELIRRCADLESETGDLTVDATRRTLRLLALRIKGLTEEINDLNIQITAAINACAPTSLQRYGVGPDTTAALLIAAGDNPHRMRTESSFAALCGVSPVEASSGKTQRRRLNRGGDRQANSALYTIALARLRWDDRTRTYLERRITEGKTRREALRCLSSATSPARSTRPSPPQEKPSRRLDIHRGIKLAVRYEATVQLALIRQSL